MKLHILLLSFLIPISISFSQINPKVSNTEIIDFSKVEKYKVSKDNSSIINDYDNVFLEKQKDTLEKLISNYAQKTTRQIAVVTVDYIKPYNDIQKFATDLANYWGVGDAKKDNGLLILLCRPCRKVTIVTGLGTEKILTDEICKEVIDNTIIPELKNGNFYKGIRNGVIDLIEKWN